MPYKNICYCNSGASAIEQAFTFLGKEHIQHSGTYRWCTVQVPPIILFKFFGLLATMQQWDAHKDAAQRLGATEMNQRLWDSTTQSYSFPAANRVAWEGGAVAT